MIKLEKTTVNSSITTLTEKEVSYSGPTYSLNLRNCLSHYEINDIKIYDISPNYERYNEFNISIPTFYTDDLTIETDTTLADEQSYLVDGDLIVASGVTLTIPEDCILLYTGSLDIQGTIVTDGQLVQVELDNDDWIFLNSDDLFTETTFIFNVVPGYYDYTITAENEDDYLEIGRVLYYTSNDTFVEYTPTENTIVYNG